MTYFDIHKTLVHEFGRSISRRLVCQLSSRYSMEQLRLIMQKAVELQPQGAIVSVSAALRAFRDVECVPAWSEGFGDNPFG